MELLYTSRICFNPSFRRAAVVISLPTQPQPVLYRMSTPVAIPFSLLDLSVLALRRGIGSGRS